MTRIILLGNIQRIFALLVDVGLVTQTFFIKSAQLTLNLIAASHGVVNLRWE